MARHITFTAISLFALALTFMACDKDDCDYFDHRDMAACYDGSEWDSARIADEHIQSLTVTFFADQTLQATFDTDLVMTAEWQLVGAGSFSLDVEPRINQLYGFIRFCEDIVEFNDSYRDGIDHFFYR